jgi:hypothetical protein
MYIQDVRERKVIPKMPNWVMNELICSFQTQEQFESFKSKINLEGLFNSFIPMPEVLDGTQSPDINVDKLILDYNKETNSTSMGLTEIIESNHHWFSDLARTALKNQKALIETGFSNWFSWNIANWGVKWDACRPTVNFDLLTITLSFDSPWDTPEQFVRTLSTLYPEVTFEMISGSIENDNHYEFTCVNGKYNETCCYETFKEAVMNGKWGGAKEWEMLFEESEEIEAEA